MTTSPTRRHVAALACVGFWMGRAASGPSLATRPVLARVAPPRPTAGRRVRR